MALRLLVTVVVSVVITAAAAGAWLWLRRAREPPDPGIPLSLAQDRAARVSNLKYDAKFRIPARRDEAVRGTVAVRFALGDKDRPLAFDFAQPADHVGGVRANQRAIEPVVANGHIVIPARALVAGDNVIEIDFVAGDAALNRNDEFLYSLFVPARASLAMPCFDQPDLKARWTVSLTVPADWTAVSNGREVSRTPAADPAFQEIVFAETEPLSTYLAAFAAGKFSIETTVVNGREFRMFHRETDAAKVARNSGAIFDLHVRALAWLEEYTGIPYPWGKFDFIAIPSFQFGGMEHAGAIFYNASGLLLDETATKNQLLGRAAVIAHETAHMWFGDLVTMRWFNDVWMKEVFANFMAAKIANPSFPEVNHELRFLYQHYPSAYDIDRTDGANPIRQELLNLNEAGSLYGAIIYQKAPIVMRQLELLMGPEAFRDGLREYLKNHAFGNATWPDLVSVLDARTPVDLVAWSQAWVDEPGRPTIETDLTVQDGRVQRLALRQRDPRGRGLAWPQRLQVIVATARETKAFDAMLTGAEVSIPDASGLATPAWVLPVGGGLGYGLFLLDQPTLDRLATALHEIPDPLSRGAALVALWESMLEGRVAPDTVLAALLAALPKEKDELTIQQMLEYTRAVFWRFTGADDRADIAQKLETVLRAGLDRATSTSVKAAWFGTLRNTATTAPTVEWLERVWRRDEKVPGLALAEADDADLALELAVRDVPAADEILRTQLDRFKNPDRKARFAFVTPALSHDAAARERFFESLKDVNNRRREAWVLEAARYLHHPLRAASSKRLVVPALSLVREIQQTGDIFFPKRWADATLSGYQSIQTSAEVKAFIDRLPPDYPVRLKWVLLSSADPLFRAARQ
ncbi:MAG TPA: M1 family aminopeptidase [Vicinamibacterales bacterium]|nr:M1 family aminopeptidase [Vicinamibacterales bacterium]